MPKSIKKTLIFILASLFVAGFLVRLGQEVQYDMTAVEDREETLGSSAPSLGSYITAEQYLVASISGDIFAAKASNVAVPIASITKLMTATIVLEEMSPDTLVAISAQAVSTEGTAGRLRIGQVYNVSELLYPLLMVSSNDAAEALAETFGRQGFIESMNAKARELGMSDTAFVDPSGLSAGNVASARDILTLTRYIQEIHPDIWRNTLERTKTVRGNTWTNTTHFLNLGSYRGGKNGFTDEAKRSAVAIFDLPERSHEPIVVIVLRSDDRTKDVLNLIQSIPLAR